MSASFERKIVNCQALLARRASLGSGILFTNGVFDILHRGHVTYLDSARSLGTSLVVGVNSDASARQLGKGSDRPINLETDRMALLAALESVNYVVMFNDLTPIELIRSLRPDILVKGGDYSMDELPEAVLVRSWGGRTLVIPFEHDHSTTKLLWRICSTDCRS
ncbi:D-glycero-beta-D-manno-heptose 1-phosphate adenylyltransferase [Candidatus Vallotiella sp. (ex Adelges kitamiensis)]|uniref:D-glycero-beta-D-manno-heptose 1-phosphate adenylyltransferase n=1 Tax=Candidatus Vallotiella sp. (ex Adelges kitamiensis) TaxID=2864217 RepID=UPI001CE38A9E|nr:D-glycero-beta-D-manno-heptose 1-phosphate adenylyltransferase [Candidatus Vallotia sp. (ex Adelges kitamiensis)]